MLLCQQRHAPRADCQLALFPEGMEGYSDVVSKPLGVHGKRDLQKKHKLKQLNDMRLPVTSGCCGHLVKSLEFLRIFLHRECPKNQKFLVFFSFVLSRGQID